jgi:methionyl-tRNA formyltransferase
METADSTDRRYSTSGRQVLFIGAVHEAEPALKALLAADVEVVGVFTLTRKQAARTAGAVDLTPMAAEQGVPVFRTANINRSDAVERIRDLRPDLIVCVGWTRLLGEEILAIPSRGCVGFHASLLPRHRGRAPVNWAILRGEEETGNTMMMLAPGADTGDIVDQRRVPIDIDDTCGTVYDKIGAAGAEMLAVHLPALLAGTAPCRPQVDAEADLLPKRTPEMGITDWNRSPKEVHDWIRALSHPYPGAFTFLKGRKVYLWRSEFCDDEKSAWEPDPGTLMGILGEALRVRVSGGSVLITRLQQEDEVEEDGAGWFIRKGHRRGRQFDPVDPALARYALGLGPRPEALEKGDTVKGDRA